MYKFLMPIGVFLIMGAHNVVASDNKLGQFKPGDRVGFRIKNVEGSQQGRVLGTYEDVHGKTITQEDSIDFVSYLLNVLPDDEVKKLHSCNPTENVDEYIAEYLNKSNLAQSAHIYLIKPDNNGFECVLHESQLTKVQGQE